MSTIEAPGRTALWTEAALRALTGSAVALCDQQSGDFIDDGIVVVRAMAIASAFEAACNAQHADEQKAAAARPSPKPRAARPSPARVAAFSAALASSLDAKGALTPGAQAVALYRGEMGIEAVTDPAVRLAWQASEGMARKGASK